MPLGGFRLEPRSDGSKLFATTGLRELGLMEIECVSKKNAMEVVGFLFNVAHYLCDKASCSRTETPSGCRQQRRTAFVTAVQPGTDLTRSCGSKSTELAGGCLRTFLYGESDFAGERLRTVANH